MSDIAATASAAPPVDVSASLPARLAKGFVGRLVIIVPYLWLLFFFLVPFVIVFKISLSQSAISMPPYTPVLDFSSGWSGFVGKLKQLSFDNYLWLTQDALYFKAYLSSVVIAGISTILTLLVGYPIAYGMARAPATIRPTLLMLVILNTYTAIFIGIVYSYLPFMVLPLYSSLEKMDYSLIEAAKDLGCPPTSAFWKITFPLSLPGVIAGCLLVFIPAVGEFVIPDLLGGSQTLMIGRTLWNEFFSNRDWPVSSAVAVILLLLLIVPIMIFQQAQARAQEQGK